MFPPYEFTDHRLSLLKLGIDVSQFVERASGVVRVVFSELVSEVNFLFYGNLQGNFPRLG